MSYLQGGVDATSSRKTSLKPQCVYCFFTCAAVHRASEEDDPDPPLSSYVTLRQIAQPVKPAPSLCENRTITLIRGVIVKTK